MLEIVIKVRYISTIAEMLLIDDSPTMFYLLELTLFACHKGILNVFVYIYNSNFGEIASYIQRSLDLGSVGAITCRCCRSLLFRQLTV